MNAIESHAIYKKPKLFRSLSDYRVRNLSKISNPDNTNNNEKRVFRSRSKL
jgi:hypothetical protein